MAVCPLTPRGVTQLHPESHTVTVEAQVTHSDAETTDVVVVNAQTFRNSCNSFVQAFTFRYLSFH